MWIFVLFEMTANKNGIAAREIARKYGVAPKTAWMMTQKIREAMKNRSPGMMVGTIVADETWVGGDPGNDHHRKPKVEPVPVQPGSEIPNQKTAKTPVITIINADTGEARSAVVRNVSANSLRKAIAEHVDMGNSNLMTDESRTYEGIGAEFVSHASVNHTEGEYARGEVSTNLAEGFFSQLKRSLDGTHHAISKEHLGRYLAEFDFRYSTCDLDDTERFDVLLKRCDGVRVSYKRIKRA
jgi:transposase-like protein